jgi:hypothetical protein
MKYIFVLLISFSLADASILLDKSNPICIDDYYFKNNRLFYLTSKDQKWKKSTDDNLAQQIHFGYDYDSTNDICKPSPYFIDLGLTYFDFNFLMALSGLLFSFLIFWLLSSFMIGL